MTPLNLAVVGGGHLGRIHTRLTGNLPDTRLIAVVEPDPANGRKIHDEFGCEICTDLDQVVERIDAAIVASPTVTHADIAGRLLAGGIHVLVEKPLTMAVSDADRLIADADRANCVLQTGHVERFNPAFCRAVELCPRGRYFEASRMSGYTFRSTDVGVVLDLMIHDIDLVCSQVTAPLVDCRAVGISIFGPHEDIAQARLEFADGSVANLTASRCSFQAARQISWFAENGFVAANLADGEVQSCTVSDMVAARDRRDIAEFDDRQQAAIRDSLFETVLPHQSETAPPANAIQQEQLDFLQAIRSGRSPRVSGRDGRRAVSVAQSVIDSLAHHRWEDGHSWRVGPQARMLQLLPVNARIA